MKYLYLFLFLFNLNNLMAKELNKPYYEFLSLQEIKNTDIYNKWVPMYQSKLPKETKIEVTKEVIDNLENLYKSSNIIGIFHVTHFKIYSCNDSESGLCVKFKAKVKNIIKGIYNNKDIIFTGDFDNAPNAESYEQIYIIYKNDEGEYYSDDFFQFDINIKILDIFNHWRGKSISLLSQDSINNILSKQIRYDHNIYYITPIVYSFSDKEGEHYLVIDSPYEALENYTYPKDMKISMFLEKNGRLVLQWTIRDFSKDAIYIHIDENIKDLDNDGYVDPILYYFLENEFKIILIYKGEKIIIRAKNIYEIKNAKIYIDKQLYSLPQEIQNAVVTKIKHLLMQTSPSINYIFNVSKQILSQPLILLPNEQLLKEFE